MRPPYPPPSYASIGRGRHAMPWFQKNCMALATLDPRLRCSCSDPDFARWAPEGRASDSVGWRQDCVGTQLAFATEEGLSTPAHFRTIALRRPSLALTLRRPTLAHCHPFLGPSGIVSLKAVSGAPNSWLSRCKWWSRCDSATVMPFFGLLQRFSRAANFTWRHSALQAY